MKLKIKSNNDLRVCWEVPAYSENHATGAVIQSCDVGKILPDGSVRFRPSFWSRHARIIRATFDGLQKLEV